MRFTVVWLPDVVRVYQQLYQAASDPGVVFRAAEQIDEELQIDPEEKGESRADERRILFARPLGVRYRVDRERQKVYVTSLWRIDHAR